VVVGFECSRDPESYAGGSVATVRVTHAGQVKGWKPDEEGYPGPLGWGLCVRLTTSHHKSKLFRNQIVSLGWMEKNGGRLFRRPKLTLICSAKGKKGRNEGRMYLTMFHIICH
jgi:hypothetical protein